jgi:predicted transcriptional regulator
MEWMESERKEMSTTQNVSAEVVEPVSVPKQERDLEEQESGIKDLLSGTKRNKLDIIADILRVCSRRPCNKYVISVNANLSHGTTSFIVEKLVQCGALAIRYDRPLVRSREYSTTVSAYSWLSRYQELVSSFSCFGGLTRFAAQAAGLRHWQEEEGEEQE